MLCSHILFAISVLADGGTLICKAYEIETQFTAGLVYLLYRQFENVTIVKPVTSRPINSERYIIAKCKVGDSHNLEEYLLEHLFRHKNSSLGNLVPPAITNENLFSKYIFRSYKTLAEKQLLHIENLINYGRYVQLEQSEIQRKFSKYAYSKWNIPLAKINRV